jgi:hypothetical protein
VVSDRVEGLEKGGEIATSRKCYKAFTAARLNANDAPWLYLVLMVTLGALGEFAEMS